jgi:hypothetical protein
MQRDYEAEHCRFTPQGHALARLCLRDVVKLTVPLGTRWAFRQWMLATMEPAVRDVLGLVDASGGGHGALRVVAKAVTGAVSRRLK